MKICISLSSEIPKSPPNLQVVIALFTDHCQAKQEKRSDAALKTCKRLTFSLQPQKLLTEVLEARVYQPQKQFTHRTEEGAG